MKKKINITIAKAFPKVHKRAGEPTHFASLLVNSQKIHTIRANYDLWKLNADKMQTGKYLLSVRMWNGVPYRSKQREVYNTDECVGVEAITLSYSAKKDRVFAEVEGTMRDTEIIAKNDGMTLDDFKDWFFSKQRNKEDAVFNGVIVHFTPFRYSNDY